MNENNNLPAVVNGGFFDKVKRFFSMLCRNDVTVSRTSEIFHMPVLAFIIVALLLWKISFIAILVSLFCGVEYTIGGEDFPQEKGISFKKQF